MQEDRRVPELAPQVLQLLAAQLDDPMQRLQVDLLGYRRLGILLAREGITMNHMA
jgi:hypothetical protein